MSHTTTEPAAAPENTVEQPKAKPFYTHLGFQVIAGLHGSRETREPLDSFVDPCLAHQH